MKGTGSRLKAQSDSMAREPLSRSKSAAARSGASLHGCDVEFVINEEHTFILSKKSVASYSGRLLKHFSKVGGLINRTGINFKCQRVPLYDFPGGPEAFEMAVIFCYASGNFQITPSNVAILRAAAEELDMSEEYARGNLVKRTEDFLENLDNWEWQDLLVGVKGCDGVLHAAENLRVVQRIANAIAGRISGSMLSSPSSPDSSVDSRLSVSSNSVSRSWWFSDVSQLSIYLIERVVKAMLSFGVDHKCLARFLLHYLKCTLTHLGYSWVLSRQSNSFIEGDWHTDYGLRLQCEVLETIVSLLSHLEQGSVSCRSLFAMFRMAISMDSSKLCRTQIERMIGSQLHKATLDNILVPSASPRCSGSIYDVDLVLRLIWYFRKGHVSEDSCSVGQDALLKVGKLIDMYLSEIAPDAHLHPQKFLRLAKSLPPSARPSDDSLYAAVDIYLEAHPFIRKAEARNLCDAVNYQRLSSEACNHISQNPRFPAPMAVRVLMAQRELLKSLVKSSDTISPNKKGKSPGNRSSGATSSNEEDGQEAEGSCMERQIVMHQVNEVVDPRAYQKALIQNEELKWGLRQMETKVSHLERFCKTMKTEVVDSVRVKRLIC